MRHLRRSSLVLLVAALAHLVHAPPADAATLFEEEELTLEIGGLGEVGLAYEESEAARHEGLGTDVRMARLKADARWRDLGGFKLQIDGKSGSVELLDLVAELTPAEWLALRAGRFKVPVSREYMIGAPDMRFSNRALVRRLAPGRAVGAQLGFEGAVGELEAEFSASLFEPGGLDLLENEGELFVSRLLVEFPHHLEFHAAYAEHVLGDNRVADPEAASETMRVFPFDRQLDAALGYHDEHWHLLVEGFTSLDPPGDQPPWAAHGSLSYRFPVADFALEPALAYDFLERHQERIHRGAAALNAYWLDTNLMTTIEYEGEVASPEAASQEVAHTLSVLLQAGF